MNRVGKSKHSVQEIKCKRSVKDTPWPLTDGELSSCPEKVDTAKSPPVTPLPQSLPGGSRWADVITISIPGGGWDKMLKESESHHQRWSRNSLWEDGCNSYCKGQGSRFLEILIERFYSVLMPWFHTISKTRSAQSLMGHSLPSTRLKAQDKALAVGSLDLYCLNCLSAI